MVGRPAQPGNREEELRKADHKAKMTQKTYKDAPANVRPSNITKGEQVLLLGRGSKTSPRYDPDPYTVTNTQGTRITAARGQQIVTRDAQKFKLIRAPATRPNYRFRRYPLALHQDDGPQLGSYAQSGREDVTGAAMRPPDSPHSERDQSPPVGRAAGTWEHGASPAAGAPRAPTPDDTGAGTGTEVSGRPRRPARTTRPPAHLSDYVRY